MFDFIGQHDAMFQIMAVNIMLASALYLPLRMGQFQVAPAAFMAVGAYATAVFSTKSGLGIIPTMILSVVLAGVIGALVGSVLLSRLQGVYLALASFVIVELIRVVAMNVPALGGALGIYGVKNRVTTEIALVTAVAVVGFLWLLHQSRFGGAMSAVRDDRLAASGVGLDVRRVDLYVFALSSAIAGLAGAFRAQFFFSVGPGDFGLGRVLEMLTFVIVGGMGGVLGPLLGAAALTLLMEPLAQFREWRTVIEGGVLLLTIIFLPGGLYSLGARVKSLVGRIRGSGSAGSRRRDATPDDRDPQPVGAPAGAHDSTKE